MSEYQKNGRALLGLAVLVLTALILAAVIVLYAAGDGMYRQFVARPALTTEDDPLQGRTFSEERVEWRERYNGGEWTLTTPDGLTLSAAHTLAPEESHAWILLVSGFQGRQMYMEDLIIELHSRGYQILNADLRAYGRSGGEAMGLGVRDKQDLLSWVRLIEKRDPEARVLLFGCSMGGAAALMTAPDVPPSVVGIVSDSAFSRFDQELSYLLKERYNLPVFPLLLAGNLACHRREGFWFGDSDPERAVGASKVPLLLIHGEADDYVPVSMAKELYQAAAGEASKDGTSGEKTLLTVPGAGHCRSMDLQPQLYWEYVDRFLDLRLAKHK